MPRSLKGRMPRRFRDHRMPEAKRWRECYDAVAARYPPRDVLDRKMIANAADHLHLYETMAALGPNLRKKNASKMRKAYGLFLASVRMLDRHSPTGERIPNDILQALSEQ